MRPTNERCHAATSPPNDLPPSAAGGILFATQSKVCDPVGCRARADRADCLLRSPNQPSQGNHVSMYLWRCIIGWLALIAYLASGRGPARGAEDWPAWRGPRADGTWQGPKLPRRWPAGGPTIRWRTPIGGGYSGVIAVGGRVFTMDRQTRSADSPAVDARSTASRPSANDLPTPPESEVERVLAFDAATGKLLWQHAYSVTYGNLDYGNGPRAAPTWHAGRLYTLGAVGHLHCLDAQSGAVVWAKDLVRDEGAVLPTWGLAASPVIFGSTVIVHAGLVPGGCMAAFDAVTGREIWRAGDDPAGYATPIIIERTPASGTQQRLLVGWSPLHVLGFDPQRGQQLWQIPYQVTYGVSIATPVFARDTVLVAGYWEGTKAVRLGPEPTDAKLLWEDARALRGLMSQPLVRDGYVYLLDKGLGLTCFELDTGKKLWDDGHRLTPRGRNPQATLVWLGDDDRIIALNAEGELILARLNPRGYEELDRARVIEPTWAHPAYAGRWAFARSDQELVCVELVGP